MNFEMMVQTYWWMIIPLAAWSLFWKGLALWRAARLNQPGWFVGLLVINTLGILEIIYLLVITKKLDSTQRSGF